MTNARRALWRPSAARRPQPTEADPAQLRADIQRGLVEHLVWLKARYDVEGMCRHRYSTGCGSRVASGRRPDVRGCLQMADWSQSFCPPPPGHA